MLPARAPRLHVSAELPGEIPLEPRQAHYLANVMRLKPGDRFAVFNGRDGEWIASLVATDRRGGTAETGEQLRGQPEAPTLTYAFAPLKKGRLDYLVEKAAEMGAGRLQPILTQHGQVHRIHREKLQRNVVEACEQCGILHVPAIEEPLPLDRFLSDLGGGTLITADESLAGKEGDAVAAIQVASPPLTVLVGPEGGFSDDERRMIADRGVRVSLGPRILRADTAAVALMALVEAAHPSVA